MNNSDTYPQKDKRFWLGILFVAIGGAWLLEELNILPYYIEDYFFNWKTLLILIGLYLIIGRKKTEPGIILIAIGGLFLMDDLYFFDLRDVWHVFWPLVVIIIGVSLILRRNSFSKKKDDIDALDEIDDFAIFGGRERNVDSANFKGGKITAMFGGSTIDLRNCVLAEGKNDLDIFVMFGGTEIIVPQNWAVNNEVFTLLGGFADKRSSALKVMPESGKTLNIKGFVMFGGGDLKLTK